MTDLTAQLTAEVPVMAGLPAPSYDGIDAMLADARSRLARVSAPAAFEELLVGDALLVDIRPAGQRAVEGEVDPALPVRIVERNVLEWRLDPRSGAPIPEASYDLRVIVLCQEGYTSSLAADALRRIGVTRATDLVGGFAAWRQAGLPLAPRAPGRHAAGGRRWWRRTTSA